MFYSVQCILNTIRETLLLRLRKSPHISKSSFSFIMLHTHLFRSGLSTHQLGHVNPAHLAKARLPTALTSYQQQQDIHIPGLEPAFPYHPMQMPEPEPPQPAPPPNPQNASAQYSEDLEKLKRLKEMILAGHHPNFKPMPRPDALASLYLGPSNLEATAPSEVSSAQSNGFVRPPSPKAEVAPPARSLLQRMEATNPPETATTSDPLGPSGSKPVKRNNKGLKHHVNENSVMQHAKELAASAAKVQSSIQPASASAEDDSSVAPTGGSILATASSTPSSSPTNLKTAGKTHPMQPLQSRSVTTPEAAVPLSVVSGATKEGAGVVVESVPAPSVVKIQATSLSASKYDAGTNTAAPSSIFSSNSVPDNDALAPKFVAPIQPTQSIQQKPGTPLDDMSSAVQPNQSKKNPTASATISIDAQDDATMHQDTSATISVAVSEATPQTVVHPLPNSLSVKPVNAFKFKKPTVATNPQESTNNSTIVTLKRAEPSLKPPPSTTLVSPVKTQEGPAKVSSVATPPHPPASEPKGETKLVQVVAQSKQQLIAVKPTTPVQMKVEEIDVSLSEQGFQSTDKKTAVVATTTAEKRKAPQPNRWPPTQEEQQRKASDPRFKEAGTNLNGNNPAVANASSGGASYIRSQRKPAVWDREKPVLEKRPAPEDMLIPRGKQPPEDWAYRAPRVDTPPRSWEPASSYRPQPRLLQRMSDYPEEVSEEARYDPYFPILQVDRHSIQRSPSPMHRPSTSTRPFDELPDERPAKRFRDEVKPNSFYPDEHDRRAFPVAFDYPPRPGSPGYTGIGGVLPPNELVEPIAYGQREIYNRTPIYEDDYRRYPPR